VNPSKTEAIAFSERLRAALEANGVKASPTVLANYFALQNSRRITPHTARNWMLGISMPRQDHLRVLATWLKVSPDQLRFGRSVANTTIFRGYEVSIEDQEFLAKYFSLSTAQKSIVRSVANYPF
jgi:transcriptional regulator with XRE-family HTH domain